MILNSMHSCLSHNALRVMNHAFGSGQLDCVRTMRLCLELISKVVAKVQNVITNDNIS